MYITIMTWHFREERATQAAARFLKLRGGRMSHLKLMKLMYLADRKALLELGRPITFDNFVSMPHGPVLSRTLDLMNYEPDPFIQPSYWSQYISPRQNNEVSLLDGVPNDQLSAAEEAVIDQVFADYGSKNRYELRDYTHTLPEWHDPHNSSVPIPVRDILIAEGLSVEEAEAIEAAVDAETLLDRLAS